MYRPPSIPPPFRPPGSDSGGRPTRPPGTPPGPPRPVRPFSAAAPQSGAPGAFMPPPRPAPLDGGAMPPGFRPPGPPPQGTPNMPPGFRPPGPPPQGTPNMHPGFRPPGGPAPPAAPPFGAPPPSRPPFGAPPSRPPFGAPPGPPFGAPPPRPDYSPASNGQAFPPGSQSPMMPPSYVPPPTGGSQHFQPGPPTAPPVPPSGPIPTQPPPGPFAPRSSRPSSPRIDPSQIPRPSINESDPSISFETRINGQHNIPPGAATNYICKDTGNCDPKFMRLSMNHIPSNLTLCTNVAIPLVAFIQPLALQKPEEEPIPVVDFGEGGPVRCGRCGAYMNPFMYFQDGGKSFVCPFCNVKNETPTDYFCYLGHDGKRRDASERPELSKGTVEFVAPPSFMVRPPMPPVHFFLIDASFSSVTSGALHNICSNVKAVMDAIQGPDRAFIGIATFDATIQFYYAKSGDGSPQVMTMTDITEVFSPSPSLLMPLKDNKDSILQILELIPKLHEHQTNGESCAGAAIEAAVEVLKPTGGKLHVILTTRPTKGSRALKPRDTPISQAQDKAEKERQMILLPQDNTYRTLGLRAAEVSVCIDLFCLSQNYVDISTCGVLSHMTGGSVYHYEKFTVQHCAQQFLNDLRWNVSRPQGFEAVLRLRCSAGLEIENYLGSMNLRNQHEIELAAVDCDKSIMAKMLYDDKVTFFKPPPLHDRQLGQRRIRVSTMGVPVTAAANQVFRGADMESYMNYLARKVSVTLPGNTMHQAREMIKNGCTGVLTAYRRWCAVSSSSSGQLILPDSMKLLPLYTLGLMKSIPFRIDAKPDEKSAFLSLLLSLPCSKILKLVYGRFFMLDSVFESDEVAIPESLPLSSEHLHESHLYLFENGQEILIKVESLVPSEILQALFGFSQVNIKGPEPSLIVSDHPISVRVQKLLNSIRVQAGSYMSLRVALRSTPAEAKFLSCLVDDRHAIGQSYVEYLCSVHRNIQNRLS